MDGSDPTLAVLQGIWGELKALRGDVKETNARLDRLEKRQTETELRPATEIAAVAAAVSGVSELLKTDLAVRDQVRDHERRITLLESHAAR